LPRAAGAQDLLGVIAREIGDMFPRFHSCVCAALLIAASLRAAEPATDVACKWQVQAADCNYLIAAHRPDERGQQGQAAEYLQLRAGAGTFVYVGRPVAPSRLIDDLNLSIWIQSQRRGLQLFGRVVLPDTIDPDSGRRASVLVAGESYTNVGSWQRLSLRDLRVNFERQVRILRARLRQPIDMRRAYLDAVVVNVFGGPGTTEVWLGQVEQTGTIAPAERATGDVSTVGYDGPAEATASQPQRHAERLIVDGKPFFPRVIEHRGEPFGLLRELGFNTIALEHAPTEQQRKEAQQLDLWLLAPPPTWDVAASDSGRILGWFCGDDFSVSKMPAGYLDELRRRDPLRRPLIAAVRRDQWRASRELDVLLRIRDPLGSSFELSYFGPWLDQLTQLARPGTPFWSGVQSELSPGITEQARALVNRDTPLPRVVQVEQVRQLALAAVAAGARGLWFRSQSPLDAIDPETQLRRLILELVNYELALIEPWGMGGQRLGEVPCENAELRVVSLATERSRLLIPTYVQSNAQFTCRPTPGGNSLVIAGVSDSTDVFQLRHVGLTPLKRERISGGLRIVLEPESADSLLLLTEDPLIVSHINRTVLVSKRRVVELEQELADRLLADFETSAARKLLETAERVVTWEAARQSLQTSRDLGRANDLSSAYLFARKANRQLSKLQADVWHSITAGNAPLRHPAAASFSLATAANLSPQLIASRPKMTQNLLRGGDCEDLDLMIDAGWRQHQNSPADISTYIALSPHQPHGGQACLRILAEAKSPEADQSVVELAPVWINSAPVTVQPGQRVLISGWVRINEPIRGSLDGCVIADSISGLPLALRLTRTKGWQRFQMTRAATRHDHLTVMIRLEGLGEVWIDDLEVAVDDSRSSDTTSANPAPRRENKMEVSRRAR
jgi:hypothetical protein